jgi:hypothetical protein
MLFANDWDFQPPRNLRRYGELWFERATIHQLLRSGRTIAVMAPSLIASARSSRSIARYVGPLPSTITPNGSKKLLDLRSSLSSSTLSRSIHRACAPQKSVGRLCRRTGADPPGDYTCRGARLEHRGDLRTRALKRPAAAISRGTMPLMNSLDPASTASETPFP